MVTVRPTNAAYTITDADLNFAERMSEEAERTVDGELAVSVGEVSRYLLNMQSQYAIRYLDEKVYPESFLGEGLRVALDNSNYHNSYINIQDVHEFVARVRQYRWDTYQVAEGVL
jgi:hypothetical protein